MLTSKVEKVTFGLLLPVAVVGNMGVVEAVAASQGVPSPGWASMVGAVLALILEVLLWSALLAQTGWNPGCLGQNLAILHFLALTTFAAVRFGYTGRVTLSWFELDWAMGWLLGPVLVAGILSFAFALHDEDGDEATGDEATGEEATGEEAAGEEAPGEEADLAG